MVEESCQFITIHHAEDGHLFAFALDSQREGPGERKAIQLRFDQEVLGSGAGHADSQIFIIFFRKDNHGHVGRKLFQPAERIETLAVGKLGIQ